MSKTIQLTQNQFAIVDDEDFEEINSHKWYADYDKKGKTFYARGLLKCGKIVKIHRIIMNAKKGEEIDHINHNTLDNRKSNLRICTHSQNMMNQKKRNNKSGVKGVYWEAKDKRWRANIKINQKKKHLGMFKNIEDAASARKQAENKYFGEFAYGYKM